MTDGERERVGACVGGDCRRKQILRERAEEEHIEHNTDLRCLLGVVPGAVV